jgi:hypothetical protein
LENIKVHFQPAHFAANLVDGKEDQTILVITCLALTREFEMECDDHTWIAHDGGRP